MGFLEELCAQQQSMLKGNVVQAQDCAWRTIAFHHVQQRRGLPKGVDLLRIGEVLELITQLRWQLCCSSSFVTALDQGFGSGLKLRMELKTCTAPAHGPECDVVRFVREGTVGIIHLRF